MKKISEQAAETIQGYCVAHGIAMFDSEVQSTFIAIIDAELALVRDALHRAVDHVDCNCWVSRAQKLLEDR